MFAIRREVATVFPLRFLSNRVLAARFETPEDAAAGVARIRDHRVGDLGWREVPDIEDGSSIFLSPTGKAHRYEIVPV